MGKIKGAILAGGLLSAAISTGAQAFPISNGLPIDHSGIILTAGGCGIGFHRSVYGYCVRNGAYYAAPPYVVPPAYVVPPVPRVCPYPYRLNGYGQCVAW